MKLDPLLDALSGRFAGGRAVRAWRLYAADGRRVSLGVKDRDYGGPHAPLALARSGGVRYLLVWDDGRVSRGYLERCHFEESPSRALAEALRAAYDDPDAAQVLGPTPLPEVELHDPATAAAVDGDLSLLARRLDLVRERTAGDRVDTWSGSFSFGEGGFRLLTSAGFDESGCGTSFGWHVTLNGEASDGFSARAPEIDAAFEARLGRLLARAGELSRPAATIAAGIRPVVLAPRVVESYVLETLLANLDGSTVSNGESHFRREQFGSGEPILRDDMELRIDPLQPLRSGAYRCTREGVPAARCSYITNGCLEHPVAGLKYARRLGIRPTPVPYASDTLFFSGRRSLTETESLERAAGGALILSVLGVHTQDAASGDFSLSAPQALGLTPAGFAGRLKATISGNLFDLLSDPATEFVRFDGEHTPGLLVSCRLDPSEPTA
ncbi:MAG TPA: metallopeptidase TldD-related protein [Candidatus Polarisedimenticolaceae bacterium]|nr:metallopeptidase TldD-related protein [Candidatus Polarisedimenticolaceae bacterium]